MKKREKIAAVLNAWPEEMRRRRRALGMTLDQLAEASGLTPNYLGTIENGKRDPSLSSVVQIAAGLGCDVSEMFGLDDFSAEDLELLRRIKSLPEGDFKQALALLLRASPKKSLDKKPPAVS